MATREHRNKSLDSVACAVVTVSDSRTPETDRSGTLIRQRLISVGHEVARYDIVPDDPPEIRQQIIAHCDDPAVAVVLLTGGTGLTSRDTTFEVLSDLLEKKLDGFGELFRSLSYEQVGSAAMLSRATAGVRNKTAVFSMPGSVAAVELAMDKLIIPEIGHIAALMLE